MEYPEQPKKLYLQLAIMLGVDIFAVQPNIVIGDIDSMLNVFIVGLLLKFLSMVEAFLVSNHQLSWFC